MLRTGGSELGTEGESELGTESQSWPALQSLQFKGQRPNHLQPPEVSEKLSSLKSSECFPVPRGWDRLSKGFFTGASRNADIPETLVPSSCLPTTEIMDAKKLEFPPKNLMPSGGEG